jgi:hypothetical protein
METSEGKVESLVAPKVFTLLGHKPMAIAGNYPGTPQLVLF